MNLSNHSNGEFYEDENAFIFFSNKNANIFLNTFKQKLFFTKQVHKTDIFDLKKSNLIHCDQINYSITSLNHADGIKTDEKNIALGIQTADCVPCFLLSHQNLFSLHLGWRSLSGGLLDKALDTFNKSDELKLFIGPHIGKGSFEVGEEVIDEFKKTHRDFKDWYTVKGEKYLISLSKIIKQKCSSHNVDILVSKVDTLENKDYCSYRRAQKNNASLFNRNISIAYLK